MRRKYFTFHIAQQVLKPFLLDNFVSLDHMHVQGEDSQLAYDRTGQHNEGQFRHLLSETNKSI